jgi:hypothetical protein
LAILKASLCQYNVFSGTYSVFGPEPNQSVDPIALILSHSAAVMIISQELRLEVASNVDDPAAQYSEPSPSNVQGAELWLLQSGT